MTWFQKIVDVANGYNKTVGTRTFSTKSGLRLFDALHRFLNDGT